MPLSDTIIATPVDLLKSAICENFFSRPCSASSFNYQMIGREAKLS